MSNFFSTLLFAADPSRARELNDDVVLLGRKLKAQEPCGRVLRDWSSATAFSRHDGSFGCLEESPQGDWLLAVGTWFHRTESTSLLDRYRAAGPRELARELEGFFAIVIGDAIRREIVVITDLVGSYHVYARKLDGTVAISASSLLLAGLAPTHLDPLGCTEFLSTGILYEDRTPFLEVRKLPPASVVRFDGTGTWSTERYWTIEETADAPLSGDRAVSQLWEVLTDAAGRIGRRFSRPMCDLTGGYDSRATVAAFAGAGMPYATTVAGPRGSADVVIAAELASKLGVEHRHVTNDEPVTTEQFMSACRITDGEYNAIDYARVFRYHDEMRCIADISINGSFGEVARGYWWELLVPATGKHRALDAAKIARKRYAAVSWDQGLSPSGQDFDLASHMQSVIERTNKELTGQANTLQMDNAYLFMRMQRWQGRIASSTNQIWPCLSPFMFRSVLETMLRVVPAQRRRGLLIRQMLSRYSPLLAQHPLEHGYPAIPATLWNVWRFGPFGTYLAGKVAGKLGTKLGVHRTSAGSSGNVPPLQQHLWEDEYIRSLLDPDRMYIAEVIENAALRRFLERSREDMFFFSGQWARLLTLEQVLNSLSRVAAKNRNVVG